MNTEGRESLALLLVELCFCGRAAFARCSTHVIKSVTINHTVLLGVAETASGGSLLVLQSGCSHSALVGCSGVSGGNWVIAKVRTAEGLLIASTQAYMFTMHMDLL